MKINKYLIYLYFLIILICILFFIVHKKKIKNNLINEGFIVPKFKKKEKENESINPLGKFGFKYDKENKEKFNNSKNSDKTHDALDEADRLDVNSISMNGMKHIIKTYNNNISNKLKKAENDDNLTNVMSQGKVFIDEFKNFFDVGLFI